MVAVGFLDKCLPGGKAEAPEPATPLQATEAGSSTCSDAGGRTAAATPDADSPHLPLGVVMRKNLAFSHPELEAMFRLHVASCAKCGELGLVGLQLVGWLAAVGRALCLGACAIALRCTLLILPPGLAHAYLMLYQPRLYRPRRAWLSLALRASFDLWLVTSQDVLALGIHQKLAGGLKLLLVVVFSVFMSPLLSSQLWMWSFAYSTALLSLWLLLADVNGAAQTGMLGAVGLLALYAAALCMLYRRGAALLSAPPLCRPH